jgi:hypothetical protein
MSKRTKLVLKVCQISTIGNINGNNRGNFKYAPLGQWNKPVDHSRVKFCSKGYHFVHEPIGIYSWLRYGETLFIAEVPSENWGTHGHHCHKKGVATNIRLLVPVPVTAGSFAEFCSNNMDDWAKVASKIDGARRAFSWKDCSLNDLVTQVHGRFYTLEKKEKFIRYLNTEISEKLLGFNLERINRDPVLKRKVVKAMLAQAEEVAESIRKRQFLQQKKLRHQDLAAKCEQDERLTKAWLDEVSTRLLGG